MTYKSEEEAIKQKLITIKQLGKFNPCEYGQDKRLLDCPLKKSMETLQELNNAVAPFEIVNTLLKTHKQITEDIKEYARSKKIEKVDINGDVIISSLMTIFVNSNLIHPLINAVYAQHFSYLDYNVGSLGKFFLLLIAYIVANFVIVVENMRQFELNTKEVLIESDGPKTIQMDKVIVEDFFRAKRQALRRRCTMKEYNATSLRIGLTQDSRDGELSDKETEESHCFTSRSLRSAKLN